MIRVPKMGLRQAITLLYAARVEYDNGFNVGNITKHVNFNAKESTKALHVNGFIEPCAWGEQKKYIKTYRLTEKGYLAASIIEKAFASAIDE